MLMIQKIYFTYFFTSCPLSVLCTNRSFFLLRIFEYLNIFFYIPQYIFTRTSERICINLRLLNVGKKMVLLQNGLPQPNFEPYVHECRCGLTVVESKRFIQTVFVVVNAVVVRTQLNTAMKISLISRFVRIYGASCYCMYVCGDLLLILSLLLAL